MPVKEPRVVAITGATAGVGRATARMFARDGIRLGLIARGQDGLEATRREVDELGGIGLAFSADVADYERLEEAADEIEEKLGPIDVWINNAMATVFAPATEVDADEYERVTKVTYLGYVHGTKVAIERMIPRNRGTIVQVGSALAYRGIPLQSAYCGAKHAIVGFTESVRTEMQHENVDIDFSMVHLPAINTPQFDWSRSKMPRRAQPVPPIFQPEVAAEAIHWAAHNPRRQYLVGAQTWKAVWGNRLAPGIADYQLAENGYASQQTTQLEAPNRPDNLWSPVPGDHRAHGRFDDQSKNSDPISWISRHRGTVAAAAAGLAMAAVGVKRLLAATD